MPVDVPAAGAVADPYEDVFVHCATELEEKDRNKNIAPMKWIKFFIFIILKLEDLLILEVSNKN
jgi:hypothetical protein